MATELQLMYGVNRLVDNNLAKGSIPNKQETIDSTSDALHITEQIVGITHELIDAGDLTDDVMVVIENKHTTAIIQVGLDSAGTFLPLIDIPAGRRCEIPILTALASTYVQSDTASTPVDISMYKIAS